MQTMKKNKILYLGAQSGTSLHRAEAIKRTGHDVDHIDLRKLLPRSPWINRIIYYLGGQYLTFLFYHNLSALLDNKSYDICWVDSGKLISPKVMNLLKVKARKVVNYNIDDPFGGRDKASFNAYLQSLYLYDLVVVVRDENIVEAKAMGAENVLRVYRTADEKVHQNMNLSKSEYENLATEVLFAGTWFPERCQFMVDLIKRKVPLTIRGNGWHKSPRWHILKPFVKPALEGSDYVKLVQASKVCLGLVSEGNRDQHTTRSSEIPAIGSLFCAKRTVEHQKMYIENKEAVFWDDADECADRCLSLLNDEKRRKEIAAAGHCRAINSGYYNEKVVADILNFLS